MKANSRERWNGFFQKVVLRQTAVNILKNHFDEALALNKRIKFFEIKEKGGSAALSQEQFLFYLAQGKLPYNRKVLNHFNLLISQWPRGTVIFEHHPAEENPYSTKSSKFDGFKAETTEELLARELVRDNRDLLVSTVAQGRQAARLGLAESDCELRDEVLKEAWLFGFRKELERQKGANSDEARTT